MASTATSLKNSSFVGKRLWGGSSSKGIEEGEEWELGWALGLGLGRFFGVEDIDGTIQVCVTVNKLEKEKTEVGEERLAGDVL